MRLNICKVICKQYQNKKNTPLPGHLTRQGDVDSCTIQVQSQMKIQKEGVIYEKEALVAVIGL